MFNLHRYQRLFPSLVQHLQVVVATLTVQQIVPMGLSCASLMLKKEKIVKAICLPVNIVCIFLLNSEFNILTKSSAIWESSNCIRVQPKTDPASSKPCVEAAWSNSDNQSKMS